MGKDDHARHALSATQNGVVPRENPSPLTSPFLFDHHCCGVIAAEEEKV